MKEQILRAYKKYFLKNRDYEFLFDKYNGDEVVSFDCETTGLDAKNDEILSIGAVIIKENTILSSKKLDLKLKTTKQIDEKSIKIHHIRQIDTQDGLSQQDGVIEFLNFIQNRPLVGYYVEFDIALVNKVFKQLSGTTLPNRAIELSSIYHDKKQKIIPDGYINLSYAAILKELDLPRLPQHSAINDALMNALIYLKLKNTVKLT